MVFKRIRHLIFWVSKVINKRDRRIIKIINVDYLKCGMNDGTQITETFEQETSLDE